MEVPQISSRQLVPALLGIICLGLLGRIWSYAKLRKFRGDRWTGLTDIPHSLAMLRGECHLWYAEMCNKYGPIARVAPNILVTSSPDVWMRVNTAAGYKRSAWYYNACRIEHRRDNVFSESNNERHARRRKQMAPGYSGRENLDLEVTVDDFVQQFVDLIRSKYTSTGSVQPMDLARKVQYFTLDVISKVGLGTSFGMLRADDDKDSYIQSSEEGLAAGNAALALGVSWLAHFPILGRAISPSPNDSTGFGKMIATCFRFVDQRAANPTDKRSDMLASFMRHGLSGDELRTEALEQVIAGSDTTATAIRVTLLHLMTNARVYAELQSEAAKAVRDGKAPSQGIISAAQAKQLPYLQAVIREATRMNPPVANIFSRDVPPGGDTITVDGEQMFLPGGTCIGYAAYAMHRLKDIYGEDAAAFRPERWLGVEADKLRVMVSTNELIWGHGYFQCLGKDIAKMELGKSVFEIARNFDLAVMDPTHVWNAHNCLGLFQISDMWVQVRDRLSQKGQADGRFR